MAFYYTEICNLHIKNYIKLFKIIISCRKKHHLSMLILKKNLKLCYACNATKAKPELTLTEPRKKYIKKCTLWLALPS